jgi:hypothetical protein
MGDHTRPEGVEIYWRPLFGHPDRTSAPRDQRGIAQSGRYWSIIRLLTSGSPLLLQVCNIEQPTYWHFKMQS